jgi:hypothetical protein
MTVVKIQWEDQHGNWQHYGTYHHEASTRKFAQQLAKRTGKRYRLIDANGRLLDLAYP